jgi:hypothetical protein
VLSQGEKVLRYPAGALSVMTNYLEISADLIGQVLVLTQHQFDTGEDDRERIGKIVRHAGGHGTEGSQHLSLAGLALTQQTLADVRHHANDEFLFLLMDMREAYIHRKFPSVFAPTG